MNKSKIKVKDENTNETQQYLSFIIDSEEYAVGILCVREIRGWEPVKSIPNTPKYIKGFINLRGIIVPIIDLRQRFNLEVVDYSDTTVVIILNTTDEKNCKDLIGITVDAVSEVYDINEEMIRQSPQLGEGIDTKFIKGIVEIDNRMVILTDVHTLLNIDEIDQLSKIEH